jgi:hypothetical protein
LENKTVKQAVPSKGGMEWQTMHKHVNKCKKDKIKRRRRIFLKRVASGKQADFYFLFMDVLYN